MKYMLLFVLATVPMLAHADESFDARKKQMTDNMDKRSASLQKMKSCVAAAANQEAVKACREAHRAENAAIADANIDNKIHALQEKKAKRAAKK